MITRFLIIVILTLSVSSCSSDLRLVSSGFGYWVWKYPEIPSEVLLWSQKGKTHVDVSKAILECGLPSLHNIELVQMDYHAPKYHQCMLGAGYTYKPGTSELYCSLESATVYPCYPGESVPRRVPDTRVRLTSHYCEARISYESCKKNAVVPETCETISFRKPLAECQP